MAPRWCYSALIVSPRRHAGIFVVGGGTDTPVEQRRIRRYASERSTQPGALREYERKLEEIATQHYPETQILRQVEGIGTLTALTFVLVLEDPHRFLKSRAVGAYLGLVPGEDQSGESDPQQRISKQGDEMLRRLMVGSAHYILGPFAHDSDLRRHGLKIAERGGKNAKKRAAVAVARKLSVLLHRLWITGELYEPLYNVHRSASQAA